MSYKTYEIYTVEDGKVAEGAEIEILTLKSGDKIQAVIVGESGRGRIRGVLPVASLNGEQKEVRFASIGETKTGKPKLFNAQSASEKDKILIVFKTPIGFRGGNSHMGDKIGEETQKNVWGDEELQPIYDKFPGEILVEGVIADGDAGRMGSGKQIVALVPKNKVFRIGYTGRRYGAPHAHYGVWDGVRLLVLTREEREASDLF
jgi:hypothetical protein